jgi:hypothetical protein
MGQLCTLPASQYANSLGFCRVPLPECQTDNNEPLNLESNYQP